MPMTNDEIADLARLRVEERTGIGEADQLCEEILSVLAKATAPLKASEIYERAAYAENKQLLFSQVNRLKKEGKIVGEMSSDGTNKYSLAPAATPAAAEKAIEKTAVKTAPNRLVWTQPHGEATRYLTLMIDENQPRIVASAAFKITPAMLRDIADMIESFAS